MTKLLIIQHKNDTSSLAIYQCKRFFIFFVKTRRYFKFEIIYLSGSAKVNFTQASQTDNKNNKLN